MKKKKLFIIIIIFITAILFFFFFRNKFDIFKNDPEINPYDEFAKCIANSEAKLYCADWAPACNEQKKMFNSKAELLLYIECSMPDSKQQNLRCRKDDIEAYPTWEFADGKRIEDLLSLDELEKETGCKAPVENNSE